jgi:hypothetical protein
LCFGWKSKLDILPLLSLAIHAPALRITFERCIECSDELLWSEPGDLQKLAELSRTNLSWQKYLLEAIKAITLHCPRHSCDHAWGCPMIPCMEGRSHDAWLHITFAKDHKQVWMNGTHSFEELQMLLMETGLNSLTTMKVRVGLVSMRNTGRSKGLRTKEEQQTVDWLLGRTKQRPKNVKGLPRMLRALE